MTTQTIREELYSPVNWDDTVRHPLMSDEATTQSVADISAEHLTKLDVRVLFKALQERKLAGASLHGQQVADGMRLPEATYDNQKLLRVLVHNVTIRPTVEKDAQRIAQQDVEHINERVGSLVRADCNEDGEFATYLQMDKKQGMTIHTELLPYYALQPSRDDEYSFGVLAAAVSGYYHRDREDSPNGAIVLPRDMQVGTVYRWGAGNRAHLRRIVQSLVVSPGEELNLPRFIQDKTAFVDLDRP